MAESPSARRLYDLTLRLVDQPRGGTARTAPTPRVRRALRLGLTGALVAYAGLVLLWVLAVPPFVPSDEQAHADYAMQASRGHLPVAGPHITPEFPELGQGRVNQHVANHPPLYHALVGQVLHLGKDTGHSRAGLIATRLIGAAFTAATMLLVARIAWLTLATAPPRTRASATVLAATLTGLLPSLLIASGTVQNDSLAIMLATATLALLVGAARRGLTARRTAAVAVVSGLAMVTRISNLPVVMVAAGAALVLAVWPGLEPVRITGRAVGRGVAAAAAVVAAVLVLSGWFYALNVHRYGDLTGGAVLYRMPLVEHRQGAPGIDRGLVHYLLDPRTAWVQVRQLGGLSPSVIMDPWRQHPVSAWLGVTLIGLAALGVLVNLALLVRRHRARALDRVGIATLLCLAAVLLAAYITMGGHVLQHGLENNRYLLTGAPFWAVGVGLLLSRFGPLTPLVGTLTAAVSGIASITLITAVAGRLSPLGTSWAPALTRGLATSRVAHPGAVLDALLGIAAAGLVLVLASLVVLALPGRTAGQGSPEGDGSAR